jgi:hypothetical protein
MEPDTLRQVRGCVELSASAVEAAVGAIAETHQAMMCQVYTPFELLGPLAAPVQVIERVQTMITARVYQTILGCSRVVVCGAVALLERRVTGG